MPLLERPLRAFLSISAGIWMKFYTVRVAGPARAGTGRATPRRQADGLTPAQQLVLINEETPPPA